MKNIVLALALGCGLWVTAQYNGNREVRHHGMLQIQEYELPVNGTPYINEIFRKGTITIDNPDQTMTEERLMRFNAFTGQMLYIGPDNEEHSLLKRENITVELDGVTFEVHPYSEGGEIDRAYFIPMNEGARVVLYKKPVKHYRKPALPEHGYEEARKPTYFDASEYYLRVGDSPMVPVSLRKNSLLSALSDYKGSIREYISDQRLNVRHPEDALRVVTYYNTLAAIN